MDLSIQQLRMLREVARQGTISAAADQLGYTPSAVSQQMSAAERTTGVAVLERSGRTVLLTDAGRELVRHAEIVLDQMAEAQASIERVQGAVAGELRLGFIESVSSTMLGPIIRRLDSDHPLLNLRTREVDGAGPNEMILSGELDASFVVDYPSAPLARPAGIERVLICHDWFRAVMPGDSDLPAGPVFDIGNFEGQPFIGPPAHDYCARAVAQICRGAGFEPDVVHQIADYPTTLRLVSVGAGVALVPDLGLRNVPDEVRVLDLHEPRARSIELAFRASSAERPAIRALVDVVISVAESMGLDRGDK